MGHNYFQEGEGKDALYKISKAYSVYDEEVGYCQGFSFMAAVLLLQVSTWSCVSFGSLRRGDRWREGDGQAEGEKREEQMEDQSGEAVRSLAIPICYLAWFWHSGYCP